MPDFLLFYGVASGAARVGRGRERTLGLSREQAGKGSPPRCLLLVSAPCRLFLYLPESISDAFARIPHLTAVVMTLVVMRIDGGLCATDWSRCQASLHSKQRFVNRNTRKRNSNWLQCKCMYKYWLKRHRCAKAFFCGGSLT